MAIVVYVSNWTDNNYLWACDPDLKKKKNLAVLLSLLLSGYTSSFQNGYWCLKEREK